MNKIEKWRQSFIKSIQLQLFISFISLPFLIYWGLPVSFMAPIGTLIFGPFLTIFLLVSSIIFFLEIFYLPNTLCITILEKITSCWVFFLSFEKQSWLVAFTKPVIIVLISIIGLALFIIHYKKITTDIQRILYLFFSLIVICLFLKIFPYSYPIIDTIDCNTKKITLINHSNEIIIIDPGAIASQPSSESWIAYTFIQELIQRTGSLTIDHFIISKINKRIFDALFILSSKIKIKNIYFPRWEGKISFPAWKSYKKLKTEIQTQSGKLIPIMKQKTLLNTQYATIFLAPAAEKNIRYYDAIYKPLFVSGNIHNHTLMVQNI